MNRYGKRCVLYPRVSTEMQVDGYSLEGQKNMLTRFADREEMIVVDTYEDAGKSGKSIEGRPAFQKMLRDIEDGLDIDYILVYKLSRFGRNAADILNSLELVQSYGVNLICIEEGIDSSQTSGKLLISVLSAVAEIERENIIEQTMNGRREKARQGGWNGGFAPYGYTLEDNKLMIEETEAVAIRKIFELYTSSEIGLGGIANQLNLQGIRKIPRQNGTLEDWTGHFIKLILDNPVYCGKIAYGRRTKEKVKGTKNDYQMKRNDDYILTEGQHKGIVSEEVWEKAHAKRLRTGVKQPSKIGRDRVHLLSGLLKCPVCGSPMYTNKHAWTNKDGTYKEIYYYVCSRNRMVRGKHCEYKAMLKKTDIEPMVIEAIREIVRNEEYAQAIKKRIGVQIDTKAVDKELEGYQAKLKEVDLNKTRLEREIDSLPADAKYRERKLHDMTLRLDSLYDVIVELEEKIEDARLRRDAIKQQAITLENIYKIMVNFDCVYNIINDEEKRNVVTALIKEIEIYRNDESEYPLKRIGLNFPVFKDGGEVTELLWDKGNTVETEVVLTAQTKEGLQTGAYVRIHPRKVAAPRLTGNPVICLEGKMLRLSYDFTEAENDCSDIIWYRSRNIRVEDKIVTAISQPDQPEKVYALTGDDVGYYIFAQIRPRTNRSEYGEAVQCFYEKAISPEDVETDRIWTDFHNLPLYSHAGNEKGVWNFDAKRPADTCDFEKWDREKTQVSWHYGATGDGSKGEGLYQGMQGARIRYTPTTAPEMGTETKRNMEVLLEADPAKSAGQGFGSAGQYLDVCIKTDTDTLDGYGLRIIRTAAHSDAVSMYLIQYVRGQAQCISREVVTNCFVTGCRIWVRYENGILSAKAWMVTEPTVVQQERGYARGVELTAEVGRRENAENTGLLIWHTGSLGTENWRNTTMLHGVSILYF